MLKYTMVSKIEALLLIGLSLFFLALPAQAENKNYFLAVFNTSEFPSSPWSPYHPDIFYPANSWKDFVPFLRKIKEQAGDRYIILDIDVHGGDYLSIWKLDKAKSKVQWNEATVGWVVNRIEEELGEQIKEEKLLTIWECCYGMNTYRWTIRNNLRKPGVFVEDHAGVPEFPMLCVGDGVVNWGNFIFRQFYHNLTTPFLADMREAETKPIHVMIRDLNDPRNQEVRQYWMWTLLLGPN